MNYIVYVLKSQKIERYYIGCTSDLAARVAQHNSGKTKSTKPYRPWRMIYTESFTEKSDAYKREWFLKHPAGYLEKRKIIETFGGVA